MDNHDNALPSDEQRIAPELLEVWQEFRPAVFAQVAVIAEAARAATLFTLTDELRRQARAESHKLAGSVGSFGFSEGSRLAFEIESMLTSTTALDAQQALQLTVLAEALQVALERA